MRLPPILPSTQLPLGLDRLPLLRGRRAPQPEWNCCEPVKGLASRSMMSKGSEVCVLETVRSSGCVRERSVHVEKEGSLQRC